MTKYTVWISSGSSPWDRTYFNELGAVELTQEQISKYFTFSESGEIEFDKDVLSEATDRDWLDPENDFVTWDTITDGSLCWGPDVADQFIGVCLEDDEENPIWTKPLERLPYYSAEEIDEEVHLEDGFTDGFAKINYELNYSEGVWILYDSYERGGYVGELELPDGEEFDSKKLVVSMTEVADNWTLVNGIEYNGEYIQCDGDTMGKGIDWYVYHNGNLYRFK